MGDLATSVRSRGCLPPASPRPDQPAGLDEAVGRSLAAAFERSDPGATAEAEDGAEAPRRSAPRGFGGAGAGRRAAGWERVPQERGAGPAVIGAPPSADLATDPTAAEAPTPAPTGAEATLRAVAAAVDVGVPADAARSGQAAPVREDMPDGPWRRLRERLRGTPAGEAVAAVADMPAVAHAARGGGPDRRGAARPAVAADGLLFARAQAAGGDTERRGDGDRPGSCRAGAGAAFDGGSRASPGQRTLEDLASDLLRPMLREWLDAHLPAIVERAVADELARLARTR